MTAIFKFTQVTTLKKRKRKRLFEEELEVDEFVEQF
jgi:hypothetical protein